MMEVDNCWIIDLVKMLFSEGACESKAQSKRLLRQGSVEINEVEVKDIKYV